MSVQEYYYWLQIYFTIVMLCLQNVRKVHENILNVPAHDTWTYEYLSLAGTQCSVNIDDEIQF